MMNVLQPQADTKPGSLPKLPELSLVEEELRRVLNNARGLVKENCNRLLMAGGKRIRPLLTICSALCFGPLNHQIIQAATAAELIHMASLVHDDVIDSAGMRRGMPTLNSMHGNNTAVLTGDYIFATAFQILSSNKLLASMEYLVWAIQEMCDGEVNQAKEQFLTSVNKQDYFSRIAKKTGILLAACCKSGAATAGAGEEEIRLLGNFGLNLGYAYQIIDDILDFMGDQNKLGKPTGVDISCGNVTLPVIVLMDNPVYGNWIKEVLKTRQITAYGIESIKVALRNAGCIENCYAAAAGCIEQAKASLAFLPPSRYKTMLLDLADRVLDRDS